MEGFNTTDQIQEIKNKRISYGISQNKLATAVGITREYLNKIEGLKANPSNDLIKSIRTALDRFNPMAPLELLFDYIRIRFPTQDISYVIEEVLQLKMKYMLHEDYAFYSYTEQYILGDIAVMASPDPEKGVLLELKGQGCRQYEHFLLAQHRSWFDFFVDVFAADGIFKRLDLAINDKVGILSIPELTEKCKNGECISVFRSFKSYRSGELHEDKEAMGNTLYIGSLRSEIYFCIYEKDFEQYIKNNIPLNEAEVKNRFEIRLKNQRAYHAVNDLMAYNDAEKTAFSIINRYLRFVDKKASSRPSEWELSKSWLWFIGENRERLKLTAKPEPYTFRKTLNWIARQVAPTLKLAMKLDELNQTDIINSIVRDAKLSERHRKILEQQSTVADDVVIIKTKGGE